MLKTFTHYSEKNLDLWVLGLEENNKFKNELTLKIKKTEAALLNTKDISWRNRLIHHLNMQQTQVANLDKDNIYLQEQIAAANEFFTLLAENPQTLTEKLALHLSEKLAKFKNQNFITNDILFYALNSFEHKINIILNFSPKNLNSNETWRQRYYLLNAYIWNLYSFNSDLKFSSILEEILAHVHISAYDQTGVNLKNAAELFEELERLHPNIFNSAPENIRQARLNDCHKIILKIKDLTYKSQSLPHQLAYELANAIEPELRDAAKLNGSKSVELYTKIAKETYKILTTPNTSPNRLNELNQYTLSAPSVPHKVCGALMIFTGVALLLSAAVCPPLFLLSASTCVLACSMLATTGAGLSWKGFHLFKQGQDSGVHLRGKKFIETIQPTLHTKKR